MIAVFDTNVLIAAVITEGVCSKLLRRTRAREFVLLSCPFISAELQRILYKKFRLSQDEAAAVLETISEAMSSVLEHSLTAAGVCRNSDDDNVIACAVAAKAEYLVTGDADLLTINSYRGVKIVSPRDFEVLFP